MGPEFASIVFGATFLAILGALHFLKPEFNPSWRMISEYAIGRHGWLMRLAFFCWAAGVLALLISLWPSLQLVTGTIIRAWFILITMALIGAGIFKTDPITETAPGWVNTVHAICGGVVILTFPMAATLAVSHLLSDPLWSSRRGPLILATALDWIGLIAFFASIIISRLLDPTAKKAGPSIYLGWPNRFMVVAYVAWLITVAQLTRTH